MHKALSVILLIAFVLLQSSTTADRCDLDHTGWKEDATAEEQAEYIDSMLDEEGWVDWGTMPAHETLVEQWPIYRSWRANHPVFTSALAMAGLTPKKILRVWQELDQQIDHTFLNMAVAWHCCGVVKNKHRQDTEWEGTEGWAAPLREECQSSGITTRLGRAYALAQAYAGPSRLYCHKHQKFLFSYMNHRSYIDYGMTALQETVAALKHNDGAFTEVMLVKLLAQASDPQLRGARYNSILKHLKSYDFLYEMTESTWYDEGIPDWLEFAGATPTIHHALVWVIKHSIAVLTLENFHNYITSPADMRDCRNILDWFQDDQRFSAQGLTCVCASRSKPLNFDIRKLEFGHMSLKDTASILADSFADKILADEIQPEACQGLAECSVAFAKWGLLLLSYGVWPFVGAYLCWRPDLLIFWRTRPEVRTPSYAGFVRQLRQQRFTAKAAKQAAAEGSRQQTPVGIKEGYAAYVAHIFWHCWCPRVRFAAASLAPGSLVSLFIAPVRLVVSGLRVGMQLLGGTAKELLLGTAKTLRRICY